MCPSLIEIGSKTADKNSAQTNRQTYRQTDRHYENNGHLAVNQYSVTALETAKHHAKFGERRRCSSEAMTRNPLKFAGVPKLLDRSQPLVGRSSPYCDDMWRIYCCLTSFFRLSWLQRYSPTKLCDAAQMVNFWRCFASCIFSKPRAAHFRPAF